MTIEESYEFFKNIPSLKRKLGTLMDVGLGYVKLGQPATTLSGGEAQRVKLATELAKVATNSTLYVLDEPTTGLDPLMRVAFLDILRREHAKGKTIVISSHMYEELETTCDRVALINDGRIVEITSMEDIRNRPVKEFKIEFNATDDYKRFLNEGYELVRLQDEFDQATIRIPSDATGRLLGTLKGYNVKFISELPYTLEKHFKKILTEGKGEKNNVQ